jgi:hypothetical protein
LVSAATRVRTQLWRAGVLRLKAPCITIRRALKSKWKLGDLRWGE